MGLKVQYHEEKEIEEMMVIELNHYCFTSLQRNRSVSLGLKRNQSKLCLSPIYVSPLLCRLQKTAALQLMKNGNFKQIKLQVTKEELELELGPTLFTLRKLSFSFKKYYQLLKYIPLNFHSFELCIISFSMEFKAPCKFPLIQ